jgi:tight adherence protein C
VLVLVLALGCLAFAAYLIGDFITTPAQEREGALRRASSWGRTRRSLEAAAAPFQQRSLQPLKERIARLVLRLNPKVTQEQVAFRLLAAGLNRRITPTGFLAGKAVLAIGGLLFGIVVGSGKNGFLAVVFGLMFGAIGFIAPDMYVNGKAKSRRELIRGDLPDALDLLAVSVEAGLGFDAAIAKVTEKMKGALSDEFSLTLNEIRIGESRTEALKKLAERANTPEVTAFTRSIIQADQFGISLGRILRVQATDSRLRRQAAAEERAMKAPIKMLFPTVLFIFPSMFLVTLGPAFLQILKVF